LTWVLLVAQWLVLVIVLLFVTAAIYNWLPSHCDFRWVWISPGSIVAIGLWGLLTAGFKTYLHFFNSYNKAYGSLGAVIILMLWMYLTGLAILVGGAINSVLNEMSADPETRRSQQGSVEHRIRELKKQQRKKKT
jgi:membrane protein